SGSIGLIPRYRDGEVGPDHQGCGDRTGMSTNTSTASRETLLAGCGAGFSGDRTDAAGPVVDALAASGKPSVLIFETLAERTLALRQLARKSNPAAGYEPLLDDLLRPILGSCLQAGIRIVSNFGAANPA